MKNNSLLRRFGYARSGLAAAWRSEQSFRTEVILGGVWFAVLVVVGADPLWWLLSSVAVAFVLATELINTALEQLADHLEPEQVPAVEMAKDCAAGAVLVAVTASLVVAAFTLRATILQG